MAESGTPGSPGSCMKLWFASFYMPQTLHTPDPGDLLSFLGWGSDILSNPHGPPCSHRQDVRAAGTPRAVLRNGVAGSAPCQRASRLQPGSCCLTQQPPRQGLVQDAGNVEGRCLPDSGLSRPCSKGCCRLHMC